MLNKIIFNDNLTVKTYENGQIKEYSCDFYNKYVNTIDKMAKSNQWKYQGYGASFRGDYYEPEKISLNNSYFNSVDAYNGDNKILFSVTVNDVSGIFIKDLSMNKDSESHIIHSQECSYSGSSPNVTGTKIITSVKEDPFTSHLALFDIQTNDFSTLTAGDCYDFDSVFSVKNPNEILFATKGVGRDADGDFVTYSPSSICRYNIDIMDVEEVLSEQKYSFAKPKETANGELYYIKKPSGSDKRSKISFIDILLIPYRILEAIIMFIETFIMMFTGKGFSKNSNRKSSAKTSNKRPDEIFIEGNLINVEKEYKNNLKHKDGYAGYAPRSWQLIKQTPDGNQTVIANGVIDYDLTSDGSVVYTDGKHVLLKTLDGKTEKLAEATMCTQVSCLK